MTSRFRSTLRACSIARSLGEQQQPRLSGVMLLRACMFVAFMVGPCACDCLLFSSQARLCVCLLVCLCVCDSSPPPTCCYVCRTKTFPSERAMLSFFLTRLFQADPDVIVGHNLFGLDLDVLMHRMKQHNIPQWSRIGRLKRKKMPNLQVCTRYCYLSACLPVCLPAYLSACWLSKLCFVCALISVALFAFLPAVIPAHHPGGPRQPQEHGCKPRCSEWASAAGCAAQLTRAHPPSQLRPHRPRPKPGAPPRESVCVCVRESVCCVYVCVKVCESVFVKVNVCACQQSTQGLLTCLLPPPFPAVFFVANSWE